MDGYLAFSELFVEESVFFQPLVFSFAGSWVAVALNFNFRIFYSLALASMFLCHCQLVLHYASGVGFEVRHFDPAPLLFLCRAACYLVFFLINLGLFSHFCKRRYFCFIEVATNLWIAFII